MERFRLLASLLFLVSIASCSNVFGDPVAKPNATPADRLSLESQLTAAAPAWVQPRRLLMEVNTEPTLTTTQRNALMPVDPNAVVDLSSPEGVASAHGYATSWFGRILTVVSPSMTVLNTDPAVAQIPLNLLAVTSPSQFLLGSLTEAQFHLLATTGIGMSDLTPDQQVLFQAILPDPFEIISSDLDRPEGSPIDPSLTRDQVHNLMKTEEANMDAYRQQILTVPTDEVLSQLKLHAYLNQEFDLDSPSQGTFGFQSHKLGNYSSGDRKLVAEDPQPGKQNPVTTNFKSLLVQQVPNVPKSGDLSWRRRELSNDVSVTGVSTVAQLVGAIAKATHLELYADASYEHDPILFLGDTTAKQPSVDLMQALALCVCGAWREVGPAFVLTDDVVGLGTRQQTVADTVQIWTNRIKSVSKTADARLKSLNWLQQLQLFPGDTTDLTDDQLLAIVGKGDHAGGSVSWNDLPSNVQVALKKQIDDEINNEHFVDEDVVIFKAIEQSIKPETHVGVNVDIELALELPRTGVMSLDEYRIDNPNEISARPPTMASVFSLPTARRAVLCAPKTAADARKTVDLLPGLGINTLFLDVFNNGRTYFPCNAIAPENDDAASVLGTALAEAKLKGISVYAVVDTFCWRKDGNVARPQIWPSQFDEDVDIFGEPSEKGVQRRLQENAIRLWNDDAADTIFSIGGSEGWVSPMDPEVRKALPDMVRELAANRDISGIVFQDTNPPGYGPTDVESGALDLGYGLANRLTCLRKAHSDPVDLGGVDLVMLHLPNIPGGETEIDLDVPGFGGAPAPGHYRLVGPGSPSTPFENWKNLRVNSDLSLLTECYKAAFDASPKTPLFMRERRQGFTIDPWSNPTNIDEIATAAVTANPYSYVGASTFLTLPVCPILTKTPDSLTWILNSWYQQIGAAKAGGMVLDLETGSDSADPVDTLKLLGAYLVPPNKTAVSKSKP
jgi:hypothetical protein